MTLIDLVRISEFITPWIPYASFVWKNKVKYFEYDLFWTTTFGVNDDSLQVRIKVKQITINYTDNLIECSTLNDCLSQSSSFYWDHGNQDIYIHLSYVDHPLTSPISYGYIFGVSDETYVIVDDVEYLPLLKSIPNIERSAEIIGSSAPSGISGTAILRNQSATDSVTGERLGFLDFVFGESIYRNDAFLKHYDSGTEDVTNLGSFFIEDFSISQNQCSLNLQSKLKQLEKKIPVDTFDSAIYPHIDDSDIGKIIPVLYGTIAAIELVCLNPNENENSSSTHAKYKLPIGTSNIGTCYVEINDTYKSATIVNTDYTNGVIEISNGREGSGSTRNVKLVQPTGFMFDGHSYPRQIIQHLFEYFYSIVYNESNYNVTQWESELDSSLVQADIGFLLDDQESFLDVVFNITANGKTIFRIDYDGDGKITAKVKDFDRISSVSIPSCEIKNAHELPVETSGDEVYSDVIVKYFYNNIDDSYLTVEESAYHDSVAFNYKKEEELEIESYLINLSDAEYRSQKEALNVSKVPLIVSLELFEHLDIEIYDVATIAIQPDNLSSSSRQYVGNKDCLILSVDPDPKNRINNVTALIIQDRTPLDSQSYLGNTSYTTVARSKSSIELLKESLETYTDDAVDSIVVTRSITIALRKWSTSEPTSFPSGYSTYTWSDGTVTDPATLNGWAQNPGEGSIGQTLYEVRAFYSDNENTDTSDITWPTGPDVFVVGYNGTDGSSGIYPSTNPIIRYDFDVILTSDDEDFILDNSGNGNNTLELIGITIV